MGVIVAVDKASSGMSGNRSDRLVVRNHASLTVPARVVGSNRAFAEVAASYAEPQVGTRVWALRNGYRVVEGKAGQRKRT